VRCFMQIAGPGCLKAYLSFFTVQSTAL
jgi:hypothetical protein